VNTTILRIIILMLISFGTAMSDNNVLEGNENDISSEIRGKSEFSRGVLMFSGQRHLVIDDHYYLIADGYLPVLYSAGTEIWFRQNHKGEVVEILTE